MLVGLIPYFQINKTGVKTVSDKFEIWPTQTIYCGVTCYCVQTRISLLCLECSLFSFADILDMHKHSDGIEFRPNGDIHCELADEHDWHKISNEFEFEVNYP